MPILIVLTVVVLVVLFSLVLLDNQPESVATAELPATQQTANQSNQTQTSSLDEAPIIPTPQSPNPVPTSPQSSSSNSSETSPHPFALKSIFDVKVVYSCVMNGPPEDPDDPSGGSKKPHPIVVYYELTHVSCPEAKAFDAIMEAYRVTVKTDTGITETISFFEGTSYSPEFEDLMPITEGVHMLIPPFSASGLTGYFSFNLASNEVVTGHRTSTIGTNIRGSTELTLWRAGEPNTITVNIHRIGCVVENATSVSVIYDKGSDDIEVQLEKYGDAFLYNTVIPEDQLPHIDLLHPEPLKK